MTYKKLKLKKEKQWVRKYSGQVLVVKCTWLFDHQQVWVLLQDAVQFSFIFIAAIYNSSHCQCGSSEHPDNNKLQQCRFWVINDWTSFLHERFLQKYAALSLYICLICTWKDICVTGGQGNPTQNNLLVRNNVSNIFSAMTIILVSSEFRSRELQLIQVLKKFLQFS